MSDEIPMDEAVKKIHEVAADHEISEEELELLADDEGETEEVIGNRMRDEFVNGTENYVRPPSEKGLSLDLIDAAYDHLWNRSFDLWKAQLDQADREDTLKKLRSHLKREEAKAISDGRNTGSNEDKRRAQNLELFADLYISLENLEREILLSEVDDVGVCQLAVELAKNNVERINAKMRFLELAQMSQAMEKVQQEVPITPPILIPSKKLH